MNELALLGIAIAGGLVGFIIIIVGRRRRKSARPPAATSDLRAIVGDDRGPVRDRDDERRAA